ncbi:MAG TPA: S8/S53 family peptidase [Bacteroidia bacterium]|nr:S8/S53 family peptidase [Bacteroidia bacterium]
MNIKIVLIASMALVLSQISSQATEKPKSGEFHLPAGVKSSDLVHNTLILKLKSEFRSSAKVNGISNDQLNEVLQSIGATRISKKFPSKSAPEQERNAFGAKLVDLSLIYEVNYSSSAPVEKIMTSLLKTGLVEYAEPKYLPKLCFTPNDPNTGNQYFLGKIQAYAAWDIQQGDTNVVIGITDTGTDTDHPDLVNSIKYNYADPIDGVDNDGDTYVDNFRGWDLGEGDNDPSVNASNHGSHVSGCASSTTNNGTGVAAPGFNCKFLPVKIADATGALTEAYEGIAYAADAGCQIINCSWGGNGGGSFGQDIVDYATINQNALVIAAAGNDNNEIPFFPASYNYVLSVASTGNSDSKSNFSNYGANVDVCAPGSNIYAAMSNNTYGFMSGTSMASPVAAGAAGIVLSQFPTYSALQVGEKLRVTCDNIYNIPSNGVYINKLGKGRINMFSALTQASPSVRMTNIVNTDTNDDAFVIGDTVRITGDITNFLDPTTNLDVTITSTSPWITIIDNNTIVGALGTMATVNNNGDPFLVKVNPGTPQNTTVTIKINFTDGGYTDFQIIDLVVNVDYINITINQVFSTITSKGRLCYNGTAQVEGLGFQYNGENLVYEAGLMIGQTANKVSDNVRGDVAGNTDEDFQSAQVVQKLLPSVQSEFDLFGKFNDNPAPAALPVLVSHKALAWSNPGDDKYIIVEYTIKNTGSASLNNVWAGIFADWDIQDYTINKADENAALKMGYVYNTGTGGLWAGIKLLTATPFNHYAIDNVAGIGGADLSDGYSTAGKNTPLSTPKAPAGVKGGGKGVIDGVASGPFSLAANDSVTVAYALIAGDDLNDLNTSAANAQIKYDGVTSIPENYSNQQIISTFPNPVKNVLTVHSGSIKVKELEITDVTGRLVYSEENSVVNNGQIQLDMSSLPAGVYIIKINSENGTLKSKFIKD